jgi:hypothetical protein
MIFPSIQKLPFKNSRKQGAFPRFRLLFYSCWILSCPALIRLYSGLTMGLTPSLFLDIIPDYTIQIKTQDTKH